MRPIFCKWCHEPIERFFWIDRWTHTKTRSNMCLVAGRYRDAEPLMDDVEL